MLPFPATLHLAWKIFLPFKCRRGVHSHGRKSGQTIGGMVSKQRNLLYKRAHTHAPTRPPANPRSTCLWQREGLVEAALWVVLFSSYFAAPKIKQWRVGARSTGRSNCSAPTKQPHWSSLCWVADMDVQTVIYICIQNGEVCVWVCVRPPLPNQE